MESIIDYNRTKNTLTKFYTGKTQELPNINDKLMEKTMIEKVKYIHIKPDDENENYPHVNNKRFPSYNVDDKIFRNANANIGLGYYQ